jgi:hypothetical protein
MQFNDTQSARIANHQACVVFDKKTGIISHIHQSITFEGAEAPSKEQFEARAKQLAREFAPGQPMKVDTKSSRLVPVTSKRASARKPKKRVQSRKS